jgi:hypothetical protein
MRTDEEEFTTNAKRWAGAIGETLRETIPKPFTFLLAVYDPADPTGALMLSPSDPNATVEVLRNLADMIEAHRHEVFTRPEKPQ